jgi:hypothetical protein
MNPKATLLTFFFSLLTYAAWGQSPQAYPKAISDQTIHRKTAMAPPAVNVPFTDPDFGSAMVRVTDGNSDPLTTWKRARMNGVETSASSS